MSRLFRGVILLFIVTLLLGITALAFFWSRFNPNDYRPAIEAELSKKLGLGVELGQLSLTWEGGVGIKIEGVQLRKALGNAAVLRADTLLFRLDPSFFFQREVDIEIQLKKDALTLKGNVILSKNPPEFRGRIETHQFDLEGLSEIFPMAAGEGRPVLAGVAGGSLEFQGSGITMVDIEKSLRGKGTIEIQKGALRNFNLVDSILRRITVIPGLSEALTGAAPLPFQKVLGGRDTPFDLFRTEFLIEGNEAIVESLVLKGPYYLVRAKGTLHQQREFDFRAELLLLEEISQFLVGRVNELSYLKNSQGQLVIPFSLGGIWPRIRVRPDVGGVMGNVVTREGSRLLEKGLEALSKYVGEKR